MTAIMISLIGGPLSLPADAGSVGHDLPLGVLFTLLGM